MRASDTAIYRSPRRSIILALPVGIAACVSIPVLTANDMSVQIAGAVWLGLCAHVLYGLLGGTLQDRPIIRINGHGILDRRVPPRPIEWVAIGVFLSLQCRQKPGRNASIPKPDPTVAP